MTDLFSKNCLLQQAPYCDVWYTSHIYDITCIMARYIQHARRRLRNTDCLEMATATTQQANRIIDDESLEEEKMFEELENEDIPSHIREARIESFRQQAIQYRDMREKQHGIYSDLDTEKAVLDLTTSDERCVVHFYHEDFRRCAILDGHLKKLTEKYFSTKFARINVDKCKFLVEKLKIRVLPALLCFINGIVKDRIIGFDELGSSDSFPTAALEKRLGKSGVIDMPEELMEKKTIFGFAKNRDSDDDSDDE